MPNPPRDRVSVSETGDYKDTSTGPNQDTDAFSRGEDDHQPARPSHIDSGPRSGGNQGVLPNLRDAVRTFDDEERTARQMPGWVPYVLAVVAFLAVMGLGIAAVFRITARPVEAPVVEEPAVDKDILGVPVRDDLNAPGL